MHFICADTVDRTGPRGFRSSIGDVGGLGSCMETSANEFALDPICMDGRSGLEFKDPIEPIESFR